MVENKKKFSVSLTSIGYKILSLILTMFLLLLTITLIVFHSQISIYYIIFSIIVFLFCIFGCFLSFYSRIVLIKSEKIIRIYSNKRKNYDLNNILSIEVDTTNSVDLNKYCFIVFTMKSGETYKISGYYSLLKNKDVEITLKIIKELNSQIAKL